MSSSLPHLASRDVTLAAARAKVQAAQTDPALVLVPLLPDIVARTPVASPLLPIRMTNALMRAGVQTLGEMGGWTFANFLMEGLGTASITDTVHGLDILAGLSLNRLARLSVANPRVLPNLPVEVILALSRAASVDDEITGLLADRPERDRALILARWGYGADEARTLEEVGAAFGITRERTRQIVSSKEKEVANSGVRLPLASQAVIDLDEAGGALPDADYQVLLRYSEVSVSASALRMLPELSGLGVIPKVRFDTRTRLWVTSNGHARVNGPGGARQLVTAARGRAMRHLRKTGAIPTAVLNELSPFGREHAISLIEQQGTSFEIVGDHALRIPLRDSSLLRQCRKTLVATGVLAVDEMLHGVRGAGLNVRRQLLEAILDQCSDFVRDANFVRLGDTVPRAGILSPAEARGFALLEQNGGAMSWWDFIEGMKAAGFSAPMAAIVLRKPAVKRLGPSTYGLRGRTYDPATMAHLRARRRELVGRRVIRRRYVTEAGEVHTTYTLNRFALQGVLPAPTEIRSSAGAWTARYPDGRASTVKVSKGFMWPFQGFLGRSRLKPGDELNVVFIPSARVLQIDIARRGSDRGPKPESGEQRILRALFGNDL